MKANFVKTLRTYFCFVGAVYNNNKAFVILKVILSVLSGVLSVVTAIIPKYMADAIIIDQNRSSFIFYVLLYVLLQLLVMGVYKLIELLINKISIIVDARCTEDILEKLHRLVYADYEHPASRSCIDRAFNFATKTGITSFNTFLMLISTLITFMSYVYIVAKHNWITLCFLTISIIATYILQKRKAEYEHSIRRELTTDERRVNYYKSAMLDKTLARDINYAGLFELLKMRYKDSAYSYSQRLFKKNKKVYLLDQAMSVIQLSLVFIIMISFGLRLFNNSITYGDYTVAVNVSMSFTGLVFRLIGNITSIYTAVLDSENYEELVDLSSKRRTSIISQTPQIEFKNVSFKYGTENRYALENFSYSFEPGKKYAIIGTNGSGKSTLLKLLLGLYVPNNGEVTINGINVEEIDCENLYNIYSVVFQDFRILDGVSIMDNIVTSYDQSNAERLYDLINSVGLLHRLHNNQDTTLLREFSRNFDDNGIELSGGEKQKLAIARALFKQAPILVLDEPTSAFDSDSAKRFFESVLAEYNKTVIYVTHDKMLASFADEIITLQDGKLIKVEKV